VVPGGDFHLVLKQDQAADAQLVDEPAVFVRIATRDDDRNGPPAGPVGWQPGQVGGHLGAEPAFRAEEDEQHVLSAELGQPAAAAGQVGKVEIGRGRADRKTGGLRTVFRGPSGESFLNGLEPQQDAAILADELIRQPGADGDQEPGEDRCDDEH
jgi:hypothetical protein